MRGYRYFVAVLILPFCVAGRFQALEAAEPSRPLSLAHSALQSAGFREFIDADLLELLTKTLQTESVRDRGELELRLSRPWPSISVPGGPIELKVLDLPTAGVGSQFIVRFELRTANTNLGPYQAVLQAKVWREVPVAKETLPRGHVLAEGDTKTDRRDVLTIRSELAEDLAPGVEYLTTEQVPAGAPILARALKPKPVVRRGQVMDAFLNSGALQISVKVEVLEDGIPGQIIRLRNFASRREFRGVVEHENKIVVPL